jgi:GPN-loop GTPase
MNQFLGALGRKSSIVNLDAANNNPSYPCAINIFNLISLEDIMEHEQLGPNGGIMYALETLEANFEWIEGELAKLGGAKPSNMESN